MDLMDVMHLSTRTRHINVELHIDELVLHGFRAGDRHQVGAALVRELSRLIALGDLAHLPASPVQLDRIEAGSFRFDPAARPSHIGRMVAQRVYGQLSPSLGAPPAPTGGQTHA